MGTSEGDHQERPLTLEERVEILERGFERLRDLIEQLTRRTFQILIALCIIAAVGGGVTLLLQVKKLDKADRARDLALTVQEQRVQATKITCADQNLRHDQTIAALDVILARTRKGASPADVRRIDQSRERTVLLINALAPRRNCAEVVAKIAPPTGNN